MKMTPKIFENGAQWLRADFHLHTKSDTEFKYDGDPNFFVVNYLNQLETQDIKIGIITNHNKFSSEEFKELRKNGLKRDIFLLPGIEFSIKDGSKGLHILIVFEDCWIYNNENRNYIQDFLNNAFLNIYGYDSPPYKNSRFTIKETCTTLDAFKKDYFIVLAHVDDSSGLNNELSNRNLEDFLQSSCFKRKVYALERANSRDNLNKIQEILGQSMPALVEGSDNAHGGIECIGTKSKRTFIKIGAFNFDALKFALLDHPNRVAPNKPIIHRSYLKSASFNSKRLGNRILHFSPCMNNFIGIRGSGKSSILETIRYGLDIALASGTKDRNYKDNIVNELLGSGGKMVLEIIDNHGRLCTVEKIHKETTTIHCDGIQQPNLKINGLLKNPLYFGQKDLAELGNETSTDDLITRLIGHRTDAIQSEIEEKKSSAGSLLLDIQKANAIIKRKADLEAQKAALNLKIDAFDKYNLKQKLNKQIIYNKDQLHIEGCLNTESEILIDLEQFINKFNIVFKECLTFSSSENTDLINDFNQSVISFEKKLNDLNLIFSELNTINIATKGLQSSFQAKYEGLKEEFAALKREINIPNIDPDIFLKVSQDLSKNKIELDEVLKNAEKKAELSLSLQKELTDLKSLWYNEYTLVGGEIDKINNSQSAIRIEIEFKGRKDKFKDFLKDQVKGSGLTERHISLIAEKYQDLIEVYYDLKAVSGPIHEILAGGDYLSKFTGKIIENLSGCLTYRVPWIFRRKFTSIPE